MHIYSVLSENLKELLEKDVFETVFCLHEVSSSLTDYTYGMMMFLCFLLSSSLSALGVLEDLTEVQFWYHRFKCSPDVPPFLFLLLPL